MSRKLTLADIDDLRAYERRRDEERRRVIALRARRRVSVGPLVSVAFENRDTIWYQIQEMARVERMISDDALQGEIDAYNPLIPEPGQLSATLFIELTDDASMRSWLPRLVGVERAVELRIGGPNGSGADVVRCVPEAAHEDLLTRPEATSAVHYIRFELDPAQVEAFAAAAVMLAVAHPSYDHATELTAATKAELLADLRS